MITFVAILIFVIASVIGFKQSKRDKKEHEDSVTLIKAEELFRKTGVEIKEVDSNGKYTIIFQGGIFEIETSNERYIDVNYTHFAEIDEHGANIQIREGYGLTECVTGSCLTPMKYYRKGSIVYFKIECVIGNMETRFIRMENKMM